MKYFVFVLFLMAWSVFSPKLVYAIPPPEFLIQAGSQIVQIFSIILLTTSAGISIFWSRFIGFYKKQKRKKLFIILSIITIIVGIAGLTLGLNEINRFVIETDYESELSATIQDKINQYDQITIVDSSTALGDISNDPGALFIEQYYADIGSGALSEAYAVSKQTVDFATFASWYQNTTGVDVYAIYPLMKDKYSAHFALYENGKATHYAVVLTLDASKGYYRIIDSSVRVLSDAEVASQMGEVVTQEQVFSNIVMTNSEFSNIDLDKVFLVDAREDEEYELGHYPGSTHIRFADLLAGAWIELPEDKEIIVICWSAIRGSEIAEYLREKNVNARYLEDGAMGWVDYGGLWEGEILFSSRYYEDRYVNTLSTDWVRNAVENGAILVDSRDENVYNQEHIEGAINISAFFTTTEVLEEKLNAVPANNGIITICDDYLSCFDAKIVGVKLEKKGHTFLGRYAAPYEY